MTRTADVPAREPVSQYLCEAAGVGLVPRPETLRCRAAPLFEAIGDGLIPCLKIKDPHRRRIALDSAIILCAERIVASHQESELIDRCVALSTSLSGTRAGCVRMCADLGYFPPTL